MSTFPLAPAMSVTGRTTPLGRNGVALTMEGRGLSVKPAEKHVCR